MTRSASFEAEIPASNYSSTTLIEAVGPALTAKAAKLLWKPVTYSSAALGNALQVGLHWNGSPLWYDFQGLWLRTGAAIPNVRSVVRDYRALRGFGDFPEYVMTPEYSLSLIHI